MESIGQKITGFRFIVFCLTSIFNMGYIYACSQKVELTQLSGLVMTYNGVAGALIAGKTITDTKGKAPRPPA